MLALVQTSQFRRDLKKAIKRGKNLVLLGEVIDTLQREEPLPPANRDHALVGNTSATGNVMFSQIGCWFTELTMAS